MSKIRLVFAGSFLQYSAHILSALIQSPDIEVMGVITTPPDPLGKSAATLKNPVHQLAEQNRLVVFTPALLDPTALAEINKKTGAPEFFLTAGYGKLVPASWLSWPSIAALNLHFSLLPKYRGANPAEWALLFDEKETGVTLIEMSEEFDKGRMIASASLDISKTDTRESLYQKLYQLGGDVLPTMIIEYQKFRCNLPISTPTTGINFDLPPIDQPPSSTPYATRLRRDDGFIPWSALEKVMAGKMAEAQDFSPNLQKVLSLSGEQPDAVFVARSIRALSGFPSVWTKIPTPKGEKRMKLLRAILEDTQPAKLMLDLVHIEGKSPARWVEVKNGVIK